MTYDQWKLASPYEPCDNECSQCGALACISREEHCEEGESAEDRALEAEHNY